MTEPSHHGSANPIDRELAATLYALAAPFLRGRVEQFIDVESRGIDFPALLRQPWSTTERAMIEIACTLWGRLDIADARLSPVLYSMDDDNFHRVLHAMLIRRGRDRLRLLSPGLVDRAIGAADAARPRCGADLAASAGSALDDGRRGSCGEPA
jgi:hypothetical protein